MGTSRVCLTEEGQLYVVLVYEDSDEEPKYKTCFSYADRPKEKALTEARKFGEKRAKKSNISLEENL